MEPFDYSSFIVHHSSFTLVPGLCPGMPCLAGSACLRPVLQRQSRTTLAFPGGAWEREELRRRGLHPGSVLALSGSLSCESYTYVRPYTSVTGAEFIRRIRKIARARGVPVRFEARPGKGSHGRLYYGERFTTLKDRTKEIGPGLLHKMLADLGISRTEIEE